MKQTVIDDCLEIVDNRFELCKIVSARAKQLTKGLKPLVEPKNEKNILLSMREISQGKVFITEKEINEDDEL